MPHGSDLLARKSRVPAARTPAGVPVSHSKVGGGLGPSAATILGCHHAEKATPTDLLPAELQNMSSGSITTGPRSKRPGEDATQQPPSKSQKLKKNQRAAGSERNPLWNVQQKQGVPPPNPSSSSSSAVFNQTPVARAVKIPPAGARNGRPADVMGPPTWKKRTDAPSAMAPPTGPKRMDRSTAMGPPTGPKSKTHRK